MADKLEIVRADLKDAAVIAALGATTFYEAYYLQDEPRDLGEYINANFNLAQILSELGNQNAFFFLVYLNQKAVGYAKLRSDSQVDCVAKENSIELQRIYLLQSVWGTGAGADLLQHCLDFAKAKNYQNLWLTVWTENRRAQKFYEKYGFRQAGKIKFPYGETVGINLVLVKEL